MAVIRERHDLEFMTVTENDEVSYFVRPTWKMHDPDIFVNTHDFPKREINGTTWFQCGKDDRDNIGITLQNLAVEEDIKRHGFRLGQITAALRVVDDEKVRHLIEELKFKI